MTFIIEIYQLFSAFYFNIICKAINTSGFTQNTAVFYCKQNTCNKVKRDNLSRAEPKISLQNYRRLLNWSQMSLIYPYFFSFITGKLAPKHELDKSKIVKPCKAFIKNINKISHNTYWCVWILFSEQYNIYWW